MYLRTPRREHDMDTTTAATTVVFTVIGMTCDHCVRAVSEELAAIEGVTHVDVDLRSGLVTLEADRPVDDAAVAAAVDEAGYRVGP
jgi:copper chaperone CopZ